ncbi:MAG: aminotransferase class III-fold pyridoxal phosphate-dependent enzyme [Planctomycetota bacterium]
MSATETTQAASQGAQLRRRPAVKQAVDTLVAETRQASEAITGPRAPIAELKASYDDILERSGAVKGRGLLYPYLGSGLGNGALVELEDGSVKWDMICGIGVHFFGHSDADMTRVQIEAGLDDTAQQGNLQSNFEAYRFGELLLQQAQKRSNLKHAFLTTSGAMANESALKVCYQKHEPASRVLAFQDCFMGRSITMAQIGDSAGGRQGIPLNTHVDYMPFYDEVAADRMGVGRFTDMALAHLQSYLDRYPKQHACFIFELVQGEGGFNTAKRDYFKALMECCKAHGVAVWDDEIQSFGRTTEMFAYETYDLGEYVDVFCVGKMTQVCATLYTEAYNPKPGLLSGTFTSSSSDFRVGCRVIERLAEGGYYGENGRIAQHHAAFREQVKALAAKHPDWFPKVESGVMQQGVTDICGGIGGMMRFTPFGGDKAKIVKACRACYDEHVVLFYCGHGPFHMRMLPPLGVMNLEDWPRVFECVERGLAAAAKG